MWSFGVGRPLCWMYVCRTARAWLAGWILGLLTISLPSWGNPSGRVTPFDRGDRLVLLASCFDFLRISVLPSLKHYTCPSLPFPVVQILQEQYRRALKSFLMRSSQDSCWQASPLRTGCSLLSGVPQTRVLLPYTKKKPVTRKNLLFSNTEWAETVTTSIPEQRSYVHGVCKCSQAVHHRWVVCPLTRNAVTRCHDHCLCKNQQQTNKKRNPVAEVASVCTEPHGPRWGLASGCRPEVLHGPLVCVSVRGFSLAPHEGPWS